MTKGTVGGELGQTRCGVGSELPETGRWRGAKGGRLRRDLEVRGRRPEDNRKAPGRLGQTTADGPSGGAPSSGAPRRRQLMDGGVAREGAGARSEDGWERGRGPGRLQPSSRCSGLGVPGSLAAVGEPDPARTAAAGSRVGSWPDQHVAQGGGLCTC